MVERSNGASNPLKLNARRSRLVRECGESSLRTMANAVTQVPHGTASVLFSLAALVALLALVRKLWPLASVALFTRVGRDKLLGHPTRAAAVAAIRTRPGVRTAQLADALGANSGTLDHHLRVLTRAGFVKPLVVGRERAWFAAGVAPSDLGEPLAPERQRLVDIVAREPGLTQRQLADKAGVAPSTVSHHLRFVTDRVEARAEGRTKRLFALRPREDL